MKIKFYTFVTVLSFISAEGRLIYKNKTKTLEEIQTENPNPTIRLTRDIENYSLTGLSKEDTVSDEFLQSYNRRHRIFSESSPKYARLVRDSNEKMERKHPKLKVPHKKIANEHSTVLSKKPLSKFSDIDYENDLQSKTNRVSDHKVLIEHSRVLVKKPIPKFSDIDYEDDFQTRMSRSRSVPSDSADHEDEDFNLDDYDFDVNHDEFLSGRKPLEPRINLQTIENILAAKPDLKIHAKIVDPRQHRPNKRERPAAQYSKETSDYYDDVTTTTERNKGQDSENEYSDEVDDSKEGKKAQVRSIRSWDLGNFINGFGDKTSAVMSKILSVLPMFPEVPNEKNRNPNSYKS